MDQYSKAEFAGERSSTGQNSTSIFEWSLYPWWRAVLFLVLIVTIGLALAREGIRAAWAASQVGGLEAPAVEKALLQDPGNPDLIHRLGLLYSLDPTGENLTDGVKYLRRAVELNPRRWDYWVDLGSFCDFGGDTACSDAAFERATSLNPLTPALQWAIGNHYLLTDRTDKAFPCFRKLLNQAPEYLLNTFRLCLRATRDPQTVYSQVVPDGPDASPRFAFLMFVCADADYENAMKIWEQMISGPDRATQVAAVKPFLDFLIARDQIADAATVWGDLRHAGALPAVTDAAADNLIYNGGFEKQPLNTGFDWYLDDSPYLEINVENASSHQGAKCLQINFLVGRNADFDLVEQVVRVKPNTRYRLTAYVRSDNVTSDSGPRLRALEMGCGNCAVRSSDPTVGTTPWHMVDLEFVTQPQTEAVKVSFWRPPAREVSGDINGTVWLDDVSLRAVDASSATANIERIR